MINRKLIDNIRHVLGGDELEDFNHLVKEAESFEKGFILLINHSWDCIPEEERADIDKMLKEVGI